MKRVFVWQQLSSYDAKGTWTLHADSGYQMVVGRAREWLRLNPDLQIDVVGPERSTLHTQPESIDPDVWSNSRIRWCEVQQPANAYLARFFPDFGAVQKLLARGGYDVLYSREPTMMRNLLACYYDKPRPKTIVHTSFQDTPSAPKFKGTLWLGQCESVLRDDVDIAFFQCQPALDTFLSEMLKYGISRRLVDLVAAKSHVDDDGYSRYAITLPVDHSKMRFTTEEWHAKTLGKPVLFFPNRVSPSSGDYTNSQAFLKMLSVLWGRRQDFCAVVNPGKYPGTRKDELDAKYGHCGLITLLPEVLNRDEYRYVASNSVFVVNLYLTDLYGATAQRECIELGACPIWINAPELTSIAREAGVERHVITDMACFVDSVSVLLDTIRASSGTIQAYNEALRSVVRNRCSYEATSPVTMQRMGLCS